MLFEFWGHPERAGYWIDGWMKELNLLEMINTLKSPLQALSKLRWWGRRGEGERLTEVSTVMTSNKENESLAKTFPNIFPAK